MNRPYAESADQNKSPILDVLQKVFTEPGKLLEIGAGTGQHAVHFEEHLPHLTWQPTDMADNLPGIESWRQHAALPNLLPPLVLDVLSDEWPRGPFDCAYSANTAHIISWQGVEAMFQGVAHVLSEEAYFALYGPFHYDGQATSESNRQFDAWLRRRDPNSGVRDLRDLETLAAKCGLQLWRDYEMPVNNRMLVWRR